MDLPMYHGKRIAIVLSCAGRQRLLYGRAAFENDGELGPILRISLQPEGRNAAGDPAFILQQDAPADCLVADDHDDCDFRLNLEIEDKPSV